MKNTLSDLNNHLFAQLERLSDEDIKGEALQEEINRAKAISDIASQIISNGSLVLKAKTFLMVVYRNKHKKVFNISNNFHGGLYLSFEESEVEHDAVL